jgi:hypothetical protein
MNKIVNGVSNDFEFDIKDYNMFPPNVEKIIMTKENYNRLFEDLQEENIYLKDKAEQLQDRIQKALEYIYTYYGKPVVKSYGGTLREIKEILEEGEIQNDD